MPSAEKSMRADSLANKGSCIFFTSTFMESWIQRQANPRPVPSMETNLTSHSAPPAMLLGGLIAYQWSILIFVVLISACVVRRNSSTPKIPLVGSRFFCEPEWLVGFRFIYSAGPMIQKGYNRVRELLCQGLCIHITCITAVQRYCLQSPAQ